MSTETELKEKAEEFRYKIDRTSQEVLEYKQKHYTGADNANRFIHFEQQYNAFEYYFCGLHCETYTLQAVQWDIMKHLASIDLLLMDIGELTEENVIEKIGDARNYFRLATGILAEVTDSEVFAIDFGILCTAHNRFMEQSRKLIAKLIAKTSKTSKNTVNTSLADGLKECFSIKYTEQDTKAV